MFFGRILCDPAAEGAAGGGVADAGEVNDFAGDIPAGNPASEGGVTNQSAGSSGVAELNPNPVADPNATPAGWSSIRDAAAAMGLDLSGQPDDQRALAYLVQSAQRAQQEDYYSRLGRGLMPHADTIRAAIAAKQAPAAPAEAPSWVPPSIDQRWLALVERDPASGVFIPRSGAGVPPEVVNAINDRADWERKFQENPAGMLQPLVEERAAAIADERIKAHFDKFQALQAHNQIFQANAPWLYTQDATGRATKTLSPVGTRYAQHVRDLESSGIVDPFRVDGLAQRLVRAEILEQQAAQSATAANPQTQFAVGQPNVNPLQALGAAARKGTPGATEPSMAGMSLREALNRSFAESGITDSEFAGYGN